MADTFYVGCQLVAPVATVERLAPDPVGGGSRTGNVGTSTWASAEMASTGGSYVEHGSWYALYNAKGSGKVIRLRHIGLTVLQSRTATGTTAINYNIFRTNADGGGYPLDATPMDSAATVLPAQVKVSAYSRVTTTGATFRRWAAQPYLSLAAAFPVTAMRRGSIGRSSMDLGRLWNVKDSACQGIVLREGEGIGVLTSTAGTARENWPLEVVVYLSDGTNTFVVREVVALGTWPAALQVFNGSGSGVVLTILDIKITETNTYGVSSLTRLELNTISGMHINSMGKAEVPVPMDSSNAALPSQIMSARHAGVFQAHSSSFAVTSGLLARGNENPVRRTAATPFGISPGLASSITAFHQGPSMEAMRLFGSSSGGDGGIQSMRLREGEGIALMQTLDTDGWGAGYWLDVIFLVEDAVSTPKIPSINGGAVRAG
jgi:hypothetical protein